MMNKWIIIALEAVIIQIINCNNLRQLKQSTNFNIIFPKCRNNEDCSNNGVCDSSGTCLCDSTYVTWVDLGKINNDNINKTDASLEINLSNDELKMCNYALKKQLTALMISIFVGFGSEHFYMGNNSVAAGKFVFYIFCYYLNIVIVLFYAFNKKKRHLLSFIGIFEGIYLGIGFAFMFCWNLYDWIKIGKNEMPDGKGYNLYSWSSNQNIN